ncbi:MAG: LysE family translocator [Rhodospirillaceae bacterium]|nr:LysE family translocator [Rhodospirillaceae bacterium]MDD9918645.1 LysE family translocator [Rhodospirillaceae bacterium]MDD9930195.1 LysE family translocator [Rhodospirillaceae bacterium]
MGWENLIVFIGGCALIIVAPGPDILLAVARGLGQGRLAAIASSCGCGLSIFIHSVLAAFGLSLLLQTSLIAFAVVKFAGAAYLIYLGVRCIRSKELFQPSAASAVSLARVFYVGFLSNFLNPKVLLFSLAFLPQFVDPAAGAASLQMLLLGALFAVMTAGSFCVFGCFASALSAWFRAHPRVAIGLNWSAGIALIASGLRIATLKQEQS